MGAENGWEPVVDVKLLIRKPSAEVYAAFVEPDRIRRFWLASSSGQLVPDATVHWQFKIAGAETDVVVIDAIPGKSLDLRWDEDQPLRITFEDRDGATLVGVQVTDFTGENPAAQAIGSTSGFTLVLASLKMWLEQGIEGDLLYDKFPDAEYADR
jgi:uncharacterized protein YndB with AHSA1/START domain